MTFFPEHAAGMPGNDIILVQDPADDHRFPAEEFRLPYWQRQGAEPLDGGRGGSMRIRVDDAEYVLRRYLRGGLLARLGLVRDRYPWPGLDNTRPAREKRVVDHALAQGLPVPAVRAYAIERHGPFYRAAIISDYVPNRGTLAAVAAHDPVPRADWERLGETLRRFHDAGIHHADLNANNILLGRQPAFTLIDFDRGRVRPGKGDWRADNLDRLLRSLLKIQLARRRQDRHFHFSADDWDALDAGYRKGASA